jgi:hypothetical protein
MFNGGPGLPSLSVLPVGEGVPSTSPGTYELASSPWGVKLGNRKSWRRRRTYQQKEWVRSSVSGHAKRACYTDATTYWAPTNHNPSLLYDAHTWPKPKEHNRKKGGERDKVVTTSRRDAFSKLQRMRTPNRRINGKPPTKRRASPAPESTYNIPRVL